MSSWFADPPRVRISTGRAGLNVLLALISRDYDYRYRHSKIMAVLVFLEPLALIALVTLVRVNGFNTPPPFGPSFWTFHATGVFPYEYFILRSQGVSRTTLHGYEFPPVHGSDLVFSKFIVEFINVTALSVLFFVGLYVCSVPNSVPLSLETAFLSVTLIGGLALGTGLANTAIASFLPVWLTLYSGLSRVLLLVSGVLFVVDFTPPTIRHWIGLNPVAQGIILFRTAFYPTYPANSLSISYLSLVASLSLVIGGLLFISRKVTSRFA